MATVSPGASAAPFSFTTHNSSTFSHAKLMHSSHLCPIYTFCVWNPMHKLKSLQNIQIAKWIRKHPPLFHPRRISRWFLHTPEGGNPSVFCMQRPNSRFVFIFFNYIWSNFTFAPIWLPHCPACRCTISRMFAAEKREEEEEKRNRRGRQRTAPRVKKRWTEW